MFTDDEINLVGQVLDSVDVAATCGVGNDQVAQVREIIAREVASQREVVPFNLALKSWCERIVGGAGGLRSFWRHEMHDQRPRQVDIAAWTIRCLSNPKCEGSAMVLRAIIDARANRLAQVGAIDPPSPSMDQLGDQIRSPSLLPIALKNWLRAVFEIR